MPFTDIAIFEFEGPNKGDVVVLDSPVDGTLLLKRVAAVPGDVVVVRGGHLTINGDEVAIRRTSSGLVEDLGTPHPVQLTGAGGPDFGPVEIPVRRYLVMGDNRGNSHDGRSFGFVERGAIRGQVLGVYWRSGIGWYDL